MTEIRGPQGMIPVHEYRETLLRIDRVSFAYNGGLRIIDECSGEIKNILRPGLQQGQVYGILGPSGGGKTTLFRLLAGQETPLSGRILVGENQAPVREGQMGVVAQDYPLIEYLTVFQNLALAAKKGGGKGKKAVREKAQEMLERLGLGAQTQAFPKQLSGGQRQRAAIGQQLLCSNDFLLLDEPFSGLDPVRKEEVCKLLGQIAAQDEKRTLIVVSHDPAALITIADHLWLLGRERDSQGQPQGHAKIKHEIDLIQRGLAWYPGADLRQLPAFVETEREILNLFRTL